MVLSNLESVIGELKIMQSSLIDKIVDSQEQWDDDTAELYEHCLRNLEYATGILKTIKGKNL